MLNTCVYRLSHTIVPTVTKMFMVLLMVTHFKVEKGALFFYIYNFQILKRFPISVGDPHIESPM